MGKATAGRMLWAVCGVRLPEVALGVAFAGLVTSGGVLCRHLVGRVPTAWAGCVVPINAGFCFQ